jgi:hypothetical protein
MFKPRSSDEMETRCARSRLALLLTVVLLTPACDELPGIDAIGVQRDQTGSGIDILKPMCPGDRVTDVSLIRAPGGHIDDSEGGILWEITSEAGSTQDSYLVGTTPPGFVEQVPLARPVGDEQSVAATIDSNFDTAALITFKPSELRSDRVFEPDGYFSPQQFETRHQDRCEA